MLDATNTDKIAMSMIYHSDLVSDIGAAVPRETFGFFEHLIQNREDNSKLLSIQIKLEGQRCPITILPNMTIKIFLHSSFDIEDEKEEAVFENKFLPQKDERQNFIKARRVSHLLMESAQARARRESAAKFRYFDVPSATYGAGTLSTENPLEARLFLESFSLRSAPKAKKNFFVRNHRELAAAILVSTIVIILGITLHFAYFLKNTDDSSTVIPASSGGAAVSACSSAASPAINMLLELHGISQTSFTISMLSILNDAINHVLGIDWPLCLDSTMEIPARRISFTINLLLNLRLIPPSKDLAQAVLSGLQMPATQSLLAENIATALASYGNITVTRLVLVGSTPQNQTTTASTPLTTPILNSSCGVFSTPGNATSYPPGVVLRDELVVVICNAGYAPQGSGSLQARCLSDGTFSGPLSACVACRPGLYRTLNPSNASVSPDDVSCIPCPPGHYSSAPAATACAQCGLGAFQNSSGATSCTACAAFSLAASTGSFDASSCRCLLGYIGPHGGPCAACGEGLVAPSSDMTACVQCEPHTRAVVDGSCLCRPGYASTSQDPAVPCDQCESGEVTWDSESGFNTYGSGSCVACSSIASHLIYVPPDPATFPTCACSPGFQLVSGVLCDPCPPGSFSAAGGSCVPGRPGTINQLSGSVACYACPAGSHSDSTGVSCPLCPVGSYSVGGNANCSVCPAGRYSSSNASACELCPPGTYGAGVGECVPCVGGTYALAGSDECTNCPPGAYSLYQYSACISCAPTQYAPAPRSTVCYTCAAGTYSPLPAAGACNVCANGTFSLASASTCSVCAAGTYQSSAKASACLQCPPDTFQQSPGATSCGACPPDSSTDGPGTQQVQGCVCHNGTVTTAGSCCPLWRQGVQLNLSVADIVAAGWHRCFVNPFLTPLPSMDVAVASCNTNGLLLFAATKAGSSKVLPGTQEIVQNAISISLVITHISFMTCFPSAMLWEC